MDELNPILILLLGSGGVASLITALVSRYRAKGDQASTLVGASVEVVQMLRAQLADAQTLLTETRTELQQLKDEYDYVTKTAAAHERRIVKLELWIRAQGHDPFAINGNETA